MTNLFDFGVPTEAPEARVSGSGENRVDGPPMLLLLLVAVEILVMVVAFYFATDAAHVVGYVMGTIVVAVTVFIYRKVDRTRQLSGRYAAPASARWWPVVALILGVALAALHAFYLAVEKRLV